MSETTIWYVTDIHGSDVCFRKFLNATKTRKKPNVLILGGDILGKMLVPIVRQSSGTWVADFESCRVELATQSDLAAYQQRIADRRAYGFPCDGDTAARLAGDEEFLATVIRQQRVERLSQWVERADRQMHGSPHKLFVNAGNDDPFYVDKILDQSRAIVRPEGRVVELDDHLTMISLGYSTITPWNCPRDVSEEALADKIERMSRQVPDMEKCVFNFHCPPRGTLLDTAFALNDDLSPKTSAFGAEEEHVGSKSVRSAIEAYQPVVGLHGHVHEQHAYVQLGRTICFNPGSEYYIGRLAGVLLQFHKGKLARFALTREDIPANNHPT